MTFRSASLFAAAALAGLTAPALAQDYDPGEPPPLPTWEDQTEQAPSYASEDQDPRWLEPREQPIAPYGEGPAMGYSPEQRAAWLDQCRAAYHDAAGRERGQVIGGLLGAAAGGVAGNRIAGSGSRLGGTLIGAGVGALAGAAIGGAVGAEADRERLDECEAYLVRYEQSYQGYAAGYAPGAYGYHYPYPYPVMWVRVPIVTERRGDCGCQTVVEEFSEEQPAPPPVRTTRRVKIQRVAPEPDKRVRTER